MGASVKISFMLMSLSFSQLIFASDHILGKFDGAVKDLAIGRVYYIERQSKFNDSKCYVESLLKVTGHEDQKDEMLIPLASYQYTSPSGGYGATTNFYHTFPEDLDSYGDKDAVYKMKLIPNTAKPAGTPYKGKLADGREYEIPKNWVFKIEPAPDKQRVEVYNEKFDKLKEKIEECIKKRLENAKNSGGGGGSSAPTKDPEKKEEQDDNTLLGQIRTTFPEYNGVKHSGASGSIADDKKLEDLLLGLEKNLNKCSPYNDAYKSILVKNLQSPLSDYQSSKTQREALVKERAALMDTLSKNANSDAKSSISVVQLYSLDLDILNDEAVIDSIGGSSLFTQDSSSGSAAKSSRMISKQRFLETVNKTLKELEKKKESIEKKLSSCDEGFIQAIKISHEGCQRISKIEVCAEDGECIIEEKSDPVPNSCETNGDLVKAQAQELKLHITQVNKKETLSSKALGKKYVDWQKEIISVAKDATSAMTDSNYDWAKPLNVCTSKDFEKEVASEGIMCQSPPLAASYDQTIGYINLQIELLTQIGQLIDKALGYDQSQVTTLLNVRTKKIQNLKNTYKTLTVKKEEKKNSMFP